MPKKHYGLTHNETIKAFFASVSFFGYFCHQLYRIKKSSACGKFRVCGYITSVTPGEEVKIEAKEGKGYKGEGWR